jgi:hypothetical protein
MDYPLGKRLAGAAGLGDPERERVGVEKIPQPMFRTNVRITVRRIRNRAVHDTADASRHKRGNPRHRRFDIGFQAVEVVVPQLEGKVLRYPVDPHRRGAPFIRSKDEAGPFLPEIVRDIGIAQERQPLRPDCELRHILGDEVLMRHRH